jgi:hypothetical protein
MRNKDYSLSLFLSLSLYSLSPCPWGQVNRYTGVPEARLAVLSNHLYSWSMYVKNQSWFFTYMDQLCKWFKSKNGLLYAYIFGSMPCIHVCMCLVLFNRLVLQCAWAWFWVQNHCDKKSCRYHRVICNLETGQLCVPLTAMLSFLTA